jgi:hypothetical protein
MIQNLLMSGGIFAALVPLAAFGILGLAPVVFVHEFAEVLVIANGLRARSTTPLPGIGLSSDAGLPASAAACSGAGEGGFRPQPPLASRGRGRRRPLRRATIVAKVELGQWSDARQRTRYGAVSGLMARRHG